MCLLVTWFSAVAQTFSVDGLTFKVLSSEEKTVEVSTAAADVAPYSGDVVIPAVVTSEGSDYVVTGVGDKAFEKSDITSLTMEDGPTRIGYFAFSECQSLKTAKLAETIERIDSAAFLSDWYLESCNMPKALKVLDRYAFYDSFALSEVIMSDNVEELGEYCFFRSKFSKLRLSEKLTKIPCYAFCLCQNTAFKDLWIPDGVTEIGEWGFGSAIYIKNLHLPASLKYIGKSAFQSIFAAKVELPEGLEEIDDFGFTNCPYIEELIFPEGMKRIGQWAFQGCMSLHTISLPNSLETLDKAAFTSCTKLKEITIPDGITTIPEQCFYNSRAAKKITIGKNVKTIGSEAFGYYDNGYNNPSVEEVYCLTDTRPSNTASDAFGPLTYENATLFIKAGNLRSFKSVEPWSQFKEIVEVDPSGIQHVQGSSSDSPVYTIGGIQTQNPLLPGIVIKKGKKYLNR